MNTREGKLAFNSSLQGQTQLIMTAKNVNKQEKHEKKQQVKMNACDQFSVRRNRNTDKSKKMLNEKKGQDNGCLERKNDFNWFSVRTSKSIDVSK